MTEDPERELTPEEDARIRSLLASARTSEQVPDDVAARLDAVLADLGAAHSSGRHPGSRPGPVSGHDPHHGAGSPARSRPRWRSSRVLLAAAVAVGVIGIAAVNLPQLSGDQVSSGGGSSASAPEADAKSGSSAGQPSTGPLRATSRLSTETFRRDVRRLLAAGAESRRLLPATTPSPSSGSSGSAPDELAAGACAGSPDPGVLRSREVLLDGRPALLEIFGVKDGARVVRAVSCDGTATLATARIPAP